jgi:hypothetical protein
LGFFHSVRSNVTVCKQATLEPSSPMSVSENEADLR